MSDPFVSLILPKLQGQSTRSSEPAGYSCSVTRLGDLGDFENLSGIFAHQLITIFHQDGNDGLGEETLQRTIRNILRSLWQAEGGDKLDFLPFIAVLERSPDATCYTIFCRCRDENEVDELHETTKNALEQLISEKKLAEDCLQMCTMTNDEASVEILHLLARTSGRGEGSHPVLSF